MTSIVGALHRLGSRARDLINGASSSDSFLRSTNAGLGDMPGPIFLECLSRTLQRGFAVHSKPNQGTPRRPALPYDVVKLIFRWSRFHRPRSTPLLPLTPASQRRVSNKGCEDPLKSAVVAVSPPLTEHDLRTLCAIRVVTVSQHEGWHTSPSKTQGPWSWFELVLTKQDSQFPEPEMPTPQLSSSISASPSPYEQMDELEGLQRALGDSDSADDRTAASDEISFQSHSHPMDSWQLETHDSGTVFTADSKAMRTIMENAEVEDVLAVRACAQYPGWACVVQDIKIEGWVWYEPRF